MFKCDHFRYLYYCGSFTCSTKCCAVLLYRRHKCHLATSSRKQSVSALLTLAVFGFLCMFLMHSIYLINDNYVL